MVRHYIKKNGERKEVTGQWPSDPIYFKGTEYIEGTRTKDNLRFANTKNRPLTVRFTDTTNTEHEVIIENSHDQYTVCFTINGEIYWYGDEKDRSGFDA